MSTWEFIVLMLVHLVVTAACAIGGGYVLYRNLPDVKAERERREERERLGL